MSELDEFMKREKPKRKSKLADYNKEILALKKNRYTVKQIHSYLTGVKKIEVNMEYLARHIRNLDLEIFNESKPEPKAKVAVTVPVKAEQKKETPVETKESKAETPEEIMARIGPMLAKSRENFTGAKIEEWQPEKKSW